MRLRATDKHTKDLARQIETAMSVLEAKITRMRGLNGLEIRSTPSGTEFTIGDHDHVKADITDLLVFAVGDDGLVPDPVTSTGKYLKDDGSWDTPAGGGGGDSFLEWAGL